METLCSNCYGQLSTYGCDSSNYCTICHQQNPTAATAVDTTTIAAKQLQYQRRLTEKLLYRNQMLQQENIDLRRVVKDLSLLSTERVADLRQRY